MRDSLVKAFDSAEVQEIGGESLHESNLTQLAPVAFECERLVHAAREVGKPREVAVGVILNYLAHVASTTSIGTQVRANRREKARAQQSRAKDPSDN